MVSGPMNLQLDRVRPIVMLIIVIRGPSLRQRWMMMIQRGIGWL